MHHGIPTVSTKGSPRSEIAVSPLNTDVSSQNVSDRRETSLNILGGMYKLKNSWMQYVSSGKPLTTKLST